MKTINDKEIKKIIQSGHINVLIGAGCSCDYLKPLGDIEKCMNSTEMETKRKAQKDYYLLIKKSKAILNESLECDDNKKEKLKKAKENYDYFLRFWANTISNRYLHIVNKQVNIFTTNFDMFVEDSCERQDIPYNDGFSGQINPVFKVANFNKIQKYKSLQFDNMSDIPLFNIIKIHGSVSWQIKDEIVYSNGAHILDDLGDENKGIDYFDEGYEKIAIINPNAEKHFQTVLDTNYASMLRKFVLELEKENSVLIVIGSSLNDKHIKGLLDGVMTSNPTLIVIYFPHKNPEKAAEYLEEEKKQNLYVMLGEFSFFEATKHLSDIFSSQNPEDENNG